MIVDLDVGESGGEDSLWIAMGSGRSGDRSANFGSKIMSGMRE